MFHLSSRTSLTIMLLTLVLVAGCGRQMNRSIAPASSSASLGVIRNASPNASGNQLPQATIVTPAPSTLFSTLEPRPIRFEWTGEDPDGHLREYRYQVFGRLNPDFPFIRDFISFLQTNSEEVLSYYESRNWEGWERLTVKKDTQPTATYSALLGSELYAFVVVAIDNRGAHDATITRERNLLQFAFAPRLESPSLTFVGPFGQVTIPSESEGFAEVPAGLVPEPPFAVSWFATPTPGTVIEGYRSTSQLGGLIQPTSLADTSAVISSLPDGYYIGLFSVEVEYDHGKRALYTLGFPQFASTGSASSVKASKIRN